jgi:hypothetical protein
MLSICFDLVFLCSPSCTLFFLGKKREANFILKRKKQTETKQNKTKTPSPNHVVKKDNLRLIER